MSPALLWYNAPPLLANPDDDMRHSRFPMRLAICSLWLLSCAIPVARAEVMEHIYDVVIPVTDQGDAVRKTALGQGLAIVLVKASGQAMPQQANPVVQAALNNPEQYLQEFSYGSLPAPAAVKAIASPSAQPAATPAASQLVIKATFSPQAVRDLLRKAGLPLWPRNRPSVLAWLTVEKSGVDGRSLMFLDTLKTEADRRGLPLVVPMNDLQDKVALTADPVRGFDPAAITQASSRYAIATVLAGWVAVAENNTWKGAWYFQFQGNSQSIEVQADSVDQFIAAGIDFATRNLLGHYAVAPSDTPHVLTLKVASVSTFAGYAGLLRFLRQLEVVLDVDVREVSEHSLVLDIKYEGDLQVIQELISLGSGLQADPVTTSEAPAAGSIPVLNYHLANP